MTKKILNQSDKKLLKSTYEAKGYTVKFCDNEKVIIAEKKGKIEKTPYDLYIDLERAFI